VSAVLGASLLTKVAFVVVAVGVTSGAIVATRELSGPVPSETDDRAAEVVQVEATAPAAVDQEVAAVAPEPSRIEPVLMEEPVVLEEPAGETVVPAVEPRTEPETRARPGVRVARREEPVVEEPTSSLDAEFVLLSSTVRGTPSEMLDRVSEYDQRFPHGQMTADRDRMQSRAIRNLCAQGPEAVGAYLDAHPSSPHASAIRSACP
jgi:hypothetical protein